MYIMTITPGEPLFVDGVRIDPFSIPHDAAEPVGYTFQSGLGKLGVATDLGHPSEKWLRYLYGCQACVFESNHDIEMFPSSEG